MAVALDKSNFGAGGGSSAKIEGIEGRVEVLEENAASVEDIKEIMEDLPDGQAVSAQVALNTTKLSELRRDFGQYEAFANKTLTPSQTGKRYNSNGELVTDSNWNVASIGAVVVGNTYELYMGSSDKMVLGTALFVAHTTESAGSSTRDVYTPLFSALSTDIPSSGYVCFEAMEAYADVLVCYRNDVTGANTLLVRRYGTKASIATQINNLKKKVDLKSFADGYYQNMAVGTADNLTSRGEASEEKFTYRTAGGSHAIEGGNATIESIKGNTIVLNQLRSGYYPQYATLEIVGNNAIATKLYNTYIRIYSEYVNFKKGHKYFYYVRTKKEQAQDADISSLIAITAEDGSQVDIKPISITNTLSVFSRIFVPTRDQKGRGAIGTYSYDTGLLVGDKLYINDFSIIDLTQMFGSGNEPTTTAEFAQKLGYDSIEQVPYFEYNEGTLVSNNAEGIKTTGTDDNGVAWESKRLWKETLNKYFPDGLKRAGSVYDEITPKKAIKRVASRDYEEGDESNTNVITNGTTTYYALTTPEEYEYDELNLSEKVSPNGTEAIIVGEGKVSTPIIADIVYGIDAYGTIKNNKAKVEALEAKPAIGLTADEVAKLRALIANGVTTDNT